MKNFLLVFWLVLIGNTTLAQENTAPPLIKIDGGEQSIREVLKKIEQQTGMMFSYSNLVIDTQEKVKLKSKEYQLETLLKLLFYGKSIGYEIRGNKILLFHQSSRGKRKVTISGYVYNKDDGEALIGVALYDDLHHSGAVSNVYGFFSYSVETDQDIPLRISYLGFRDSLVWISPDHKGTLDLNLTESANELEEVVVKADRISTTQMSNITVKPSDIELLPSFMGVQDVIKTLTLMPGVKASNDNSTGFYVRGGGPDQNLILVDGGIIYNSAHAFDLFSTFNPDAIRHVDLIKGGFPARYGGRLSSVMDVSLREGNKERFTGEFGLGYLLSSFTFEGPIIKEKASFLISGRRSFMDIPFRAIGDIRDGETGETISQYFIFQDLTAKTNFKLSEKDHIYASYYGSGDVFNVKVGNRFDIGEGLIDTHIKVDIAWQNQIISTRWNHVFNDKLFLNTTLAYSKFNIGIDIDNQVIGEKGYDINNGVTNRFSSKIEDLSFKTQFEYFPNPNHRIKFGSQSIRHDFLPGFGAITTTSSQAANNLDTTFMDRSIVSFENALFIEDDFNITKNLSANIGLHASHLNVEDFNFFSLQPRVSVNHKIGRKTSLSFSYASMAQYLHLLTNGTLGIPIDLWVPSIKEAPPMTSEQIAVGAKRELSPSISLTLEGYYKSMDNLITYKEGVDFSNAKEPWQEKIFTDGDGEAYGMELLIRKTQGKTTGWIGYTLSWTNRSFDEIDNGIPYNYKYDRRHDASVVLSHKFSKKFNLGLTWVYNTGNSVSFPIGAHTALPELPHLREDMITSRTENTIEIYEGKNKINMPAYHRLDIGANFVKKKKRGIRTWNLSIYNAYIRQNPFLIFVEHGIDGESYNLPNTGTFRTLRQVTAYWIIPSISYNFKFN